MRAPDWTHMLLLVTVSHLLAQPPLLHYTLRMTNPHSHNDLMQLFLAWKTHHHFEAKWNFTRPLFSSLFVLRRINRHTQQQHSTLSELWNNRLTILTKGWSFTKFFCPEWKIYLSGLSLTTQRGVIWDNSMCTVTSNPSSSFSLCLHLRQSSIKVLAKVKLLQVAAVVINRTSMLLSRWTWLGFVFPVGGQS